MTFAGEHRAVTGIESNPEHGTDVILVVKDDIALLKLIASDRD